jgi:hypothetical protein
VKVIAVMYDGRELSAKAKQFLEHNGWYDEDDGIYWLTETEILDSLNDGSEETCPSIPHGWWDDAGFGTDQRKELEKLWSMGNGDIEARWEKV